MKKICLLILFVGTLLHSCKKEEDEKPNYYSPHVGLVVYSYDSISSYSSPYKFKTDSYWVYENDSTFALDSVVVDSISTDFYISSPIFYDGNGVMQSIKTEFYKMYFHHYGTSQLYNQTLMTDYLVRNYSGDYYSSILGQNIYATNSPIGTTSNGMTIIAKYLSMNIGINTFSNVDEVKIIAADQSFPEFLYDTYLYYCDSVGLIKKETELSPGNIESWSLKRWNIVR